MPTKRNKRREPDPVGNLTKQLRFRVREETYAEVTRMAAELSIDITDQARRLLEMGVDVEREGGKDPMLNRKIEAAVERCVAAALDSRIAELKKELKSLLGKDLAQPKGGSARPGQKPNLKSVI